jgi:hypothetical protein
VAAGVRGRGLLRHRLGHDGARSLASSASLADAVAILSGTAYGRELRGDVGLGPAQRAVSATLLWHLRILAGWAPPLRADSLRLMAAGFEIANVTGHLARLQGLPALAPYSLGSLATAWPAVSAARTTGQVRQVLRASPWGDPQTDDLPALRLALQLAWARRVVDGAPGATDWATTGAALVLARVLGNDALPALSRSARRDATHILGPRWQRARSLDELARLLPHAGAGALSGIGGPDELWRAEIGWWEAMESSAASLVARLRRDASDAVGVAALLAADAWRTRAALAMAARGGGELGKVADAVA